MIQSKLVNILKTFSNKELKNFGDFVNSPFHNKDQKMILLYDQLRNFNKGYNNDSFTKENIFGKIYPGKKYDDPTFRNLVSDLLKLAEYFLIFTAIGNNRLEKLRILNDELINRNAYENFLKNYKFSMNELERSKTRNNEYAYYKWKFNYQQLQALNKYSKEFADYTDELINTKENLTRYFMLEILKYYEPMSQFKSTKIKENDYMFLDAILNQIEKSENDPVLTTYYTCFKMKNTNREKYYFVLKELLGMHSDLFDKLEVKNFYTSLNAFIAEKVNSNDKRYYDEYINLTEIILGNGCFNNAAGYFSEIHLRNIVIICMRMKNYDKAWEFVEKYSYMLVPDVRFNTYHFCIAYIQFYRKQFERSLESLSQIKQEDYLMKLQIDNIVLRIYYELNIIENCYSLIDSAAHFIKTNKQSTKIYKEFYTNFLKAFKELLRCRLNPDNSSLMSLKNKILNEPAITSKKWLLEKISEL